MNSAFAIFIFAMQGMAIGVDEFIFHRVRRLPRWERWGHPADSLTVLLCLTLTLIFPPVANWTRIYFGLAVFSCLWVTKDEWVHAKQCEPAEHWLHAMLFLLHPVLLWTGFALWKNGDKTILRVETLLCLAILLYQFLYWNLPWPRRPLPE